MLRTVQRETRDRAIVLTIYCLGLRVSELCALTLQETDLARGTTGDGPMKLAIWP